MATKTQFNDDLFHLRKLNNDMKDGYKSIEIDLEVGISGAQD